MKVTIEVSEENEGTAAPWWVIIDPEQNFNKDISGVRNIAGMVIGPYFSREEANAELRDRSYYYSKNAVVYCMGGSYTRQYANKVKF